MDSGPLSQQEIDALLAAASETDIEQVEEVVEQPGPGASAESGAVPETEPAAATGPRVVAKPVEFEPMDHMVGTSAPIDSVSLILDVPMDITVLLGGARKTVKEILSLSQGSVVELDRQSGEPVDILVNGKLLARGEVVVIDENFGVRVSEVVSKAERLNGLK